MQRITKFTDLEVWKEAHELTLLVYQVTQRNFPKEEIYGLTSQVRRAVVSVESCIAEGFGRYHFKERINFYYDARGSLTEVMTQMVIAKDLTYITPNEYKMISTKIDTISAILNGLIRSTKNMIKKS